MDALASVVVGLVVGLTVDGVLLDDEDEVEVDGRLVDSEDDDDLLRDDDGRDVVDVKEEEEEEGVVILLVTLGDVITLGLEIVRDGVDICVVVNRLDLEIEFNDWWDGDWERMAHEDSNCEVTVPNVGTGMEDVDGGEGVDI